MANQEERSAKREEEVFWRTCPICCAGNTASPRFETFLPLIKHMAEHLWDWEGTPSRDTGDVFRSLQKPSKQKFPPRAKPLLLMVAEWIEEALNTFPEINSMQTSDLKVADQLAGLAQRLPDNFGEQKEYLLKHNDKLRDTGMDPKWPRTPGNQVRFIAESMAGAAWDLKPSASREFIRQEKGRKSAVPGADQRWWDTTLKGSAIDKG